MRKLREWFSKLLSIEIIHRILNGSTKIFCNVIMNIFYNVKQHYYVFKIYKALGKLILELKNKFSTRNNILLLYKITSLF